MTKRIKHVDCKHAANELHSTPAGLIAEKRAPLAMRRMRELGEQSIQHAGFLMWAMQPRNRKRRKPIGKVVDRAETTLRQWCETYSWAERARFPEAEYWAVYLFHRMYPSLVVKALAELRGLDRLRAVIEGESDEPGMEQAGAAASEPERTAASVEAAAERRNEVVEAAKRVAQDTQTTYDRAMKLCQASLGLLGKEMQEGRAKPKIQDLPNIVRTYMLLTGGPTEIVAQLADLDKPKVVESARVQTARQTGDEVAVLEAMRQDAHELSVVLDSILVARTERNDNVVRFPKEATTDGDPD